jgi:hypothetical protein
MKRKEKRKKSRRGESITKFLNARLDAVMDLIYLHLRLQLRRRWILNLLKTTRSDRGWKLEGPLVALPLPVPLPPLPPLPPLALLLPMPLLPLLVQLPPLLLQLSLLLPPVALLVDRYRSRSLKTKKATAGPRMELRSASPCTVRALQRRAGRAGVVRPFRKACGVSSSALNTRACGRDSSPAAK